MGQSVEVVVSELHSAAARLDDAAQRLQDGLASVNDETTRLLGADWKGGAASAYRPVWEKWHDGARQVVTGLQRMSELLTIAGKEYVKTDESASGALGSTMQGSGGPARGGGSSSGSSSPSGSPGTGQGAGGADHTVSAHDATGSAPGMQQAMAAAMQVGQLAGQPLSQVGQVASGLAQATTGLAQQVTQLATAAAEHAEEASSKDSGKKQPAGEPGDAAAPGERSTETAPTDSAPGRHREPPRAGTQPSE